MSAATRTRPPLARALLVALGAAIAWPFIPVPLPAAVLRLHGTALHVEVARSAAAMQRGLMGRKHLAPDAGMLFVFPRPVRACMWMKHTY